MLNKHDRKSHAILNEEGEYLMELRVLQYFLTVAREQSVSGAAFHPRKSQNHPY